MGERKSKAYLEKIKNKYGVDELYSWSKYHLGKTDPYGYLLRYILKEKETRYSIYGVSGGKCHDILEDFYTGKLQYDDMIKEYDMALYEMELAGLKYNRSDEKKNATIAKKYEDNMKLFFVGHIPTEGKTICEQFIVIKVGKYIFQGYIDFIHKVGDKYHIIDFKTSTIYTGKKIDEENGQLVLYAESLIQLGVPIENIVIGWNFLKYTKVNVLTTTKDKETKLEKTRSKNCLRTEWVSEMKSYLTKLLSKLTEYDELEIEDMVQTACENNNLDNIPEHIKSRFTKEDCFVQIPLTQDTIDDLKHNIETTIDRLKEKELEYAETKDDTLFWTVIDKKNEYFFNNLCGYNGKQHKPYGEYLDTINMFTREPKQSNKSNDKDDLSWLDDL